MAVFRVERTGDYTVMSNFHLKDKRLSLKAKGLLSQMLSLPDDWDYTLSGLSYINRESKDAIRSAVNELETAGYIRRRQTTDASGKFAANEYTIFERPIEGEPMLDKPLSENPITVNPSAVNPLPENPTQLNTKKSNTQKQNTHGSNTDSIPFRETAAARPPERKGRDAMSVSEIENYRELILENIEYDYLCREFATYREDLDEIVELMVETVCARRKTTRIAGSDFPHEVVRSRFLKLDSEHIRFVMDSLQKNTTEVRNMKQYLLTVLFNAPTTISNHYTSQVNHDMNAGGYAMNQMEIFKNPEFGSIRVIEENGKYLFCGTDVAAALGYSNSRDAIIRHCRYVVKRDAPHPQSPDRKISMTFIPEGDLYRLIVHSKLPSAEQFEQWVFDEVLPTIRKHGAYLTREKLWEVATSPEALMKLCSDLLAEREANISLRKENAQLEGKAAFYDLFIDLKHSTNLRTTAKELDVPERRFVRFLIERRFVYRTASGNVLPYANVKNTGLFCVKDYCNHGHTGSYTLVTPKGKLYFAQLREMILLVS